MKYLLPLILLFILSCSKKENGDTSSPSAKLFSKIEFFKGNYNLKGPVYEVRETEFHAEGDTSSFVITETDTIRNREGYSYLRFNRDGYLTDLEETDITTIFSRIDIDTIQKCYTLNKSNIPLAGTERSFRTVVDTKTTTSTKLEESIYNCTFVYHGDTVRTKSKDKNLDAVLVLVATDSTVDFKMGTPDSDYYYRREGFFGTPGFFCVTLIEYADSKQVVEYTFTNDMLEKIRVIETSPQNDTATFEYFYNTYQDVISSRETKSKRVGSPCEQRQYQYTYDEHNNWIERAMFIDGEVESVVRRAILYYN